MPKAKVVTSAEREYLERRLAPVLRALREEDALRDEFLMFVRARGGSLSLTLERLKTVWWPSRRSMYPGFFVLAVVEFGLDHGLFAAESGANVAGPGNDLRRRTKQVLQAKLTRRARPGSP